MHNEWSEVEKSHFWKGDLLPVFATLLDSVTKALNIVQPLPVKLEVTIIGDNWSVIIRVGLHSYNIFLHKSVATSLYSCTSVAQTKYEASYLYQQRHDLFARNAEKNGKR